MSSPRRSTKGHVVLPRAIRERRRFRGLPHVTIENPRLAATALQWAKAGMDFADALHLAAAGNCEAFVSFAAQFIAEAAVFGAAVRLA